MNNKKTGNSFEKELCERLADNGFWVHNFANKTNGQPADIIAVRNKTAYLIDAKVCTNDIFDTSRVEENQKNAMFLWQKCGNGRGYFALRISEGTYFIDCDTILMAKQDKRNLNLSDITSIGSAYAVWLEDANENNS